MTNVKPTFTMGATMPVSRDGTLQRTTSHLWRLIISRAVVVIVLGGATGSLLTALGISEGLITTVVLAVTWIGSLATASLHGNTSAILLWTLLFDATIGIYQAVLYTAQPGHSVLLRLGPLLLSGVILGLVCVGRARRVGLLPTMWLVTNFAALLPLNRSSDSILDGLVFWALNAFVPLAFYLAVKAVQAEGRPRRELESIMTWSVFVMCLVPVLLLPIEFAERHTSNFAALQFGGRSYSTLGVVMITSPVLYYSMGRLPGTARTTMYAIMLLVLGLSFSRGALVAAVLTLLGIITFGGNRRSRVLLRLAVASTALLCVAFVLFSSYLGDGVHFWLLRANIASNVNDSRSFSLNAFLASGRGDIWAFGVDAWRNSPVWGHGIGSTPGLFRQATDGALSYSGMHNLFLTVLAERGVVGLAGVCILLGRIVGLTWRTTTSATGRRLATYLFCIFVVFASSTGVELFLNSTGSSNVSVTIYLFVLAALLANDPDEVRAPHRQSNLRTSGRRGVHQGAAGPSPADL